MSTYEETDEYGQSISPASGSSVATNLEDLTITYSYDLFNRLTESKTGKKVTSFTYTADDYRLSKSSENEAIIYVYEGDKVAFEEDASGNITAINHLGTSKYARSVYEEGTETTFYYRFNAYGDVTALIATDGNVIAEYEYDAFGSLTSQPDSKVNNSTTYRGYEYDSETGLYYLNARYYDSTTARFLTEDTYRGEKNDPLSLNLYTYCKNNPLKYTDPTGHTAMDYGYIGGNSQKSKSKQDQKEIKKDQKGIKKARENQLSDDIAAFAGGILLTSVGVVFTAGASAAAFPVVAVIGFTCGAAALTCGLSNIGQGVDGLTKFFTTADEYLSSNQVRDYFFNGNDADYVSFQMAITAIGDFNLEYGDLTINRIKNKFDYICKKISDKINGIFKTYYNSDGSPIWPPNNGFKGAPEKITLKPGTIIDRYGYDNGKFVSPYGTPYTERSLPKGTDSKPYTVFEVLKPIEVQSGIIAPWFGEKGGGIQYQFNLPISELLDRGILRKVDSNK